MEIVDYGDGTRILIAVPGPKAWPALLKRLISEYALKPSYGDIEPLTIFDDERHHYLLFHSGWNGEKRVHAPLIHAEIRDGKIHIHWDGAGDGITPELIDAGIPKSLIVQDWYPPEYRKYTPFAVA